MIISKDKTKQLEEAAAPLIKFLAENFHPHVKCIVENDSIEILEGLALIIKKDFIKD